MRSFTLALAAALLAGASLHAQPGTPPPAKPADNNLDAYLRRWEQEMRAIKVLDIDLERAEKDKAFQVERKFTGFAKYMKNGSGPTALNLAVLEMKEKGKPDVHEKFVCTGTYIYQFSPAKQEIYARKLPAPKPGQVGDDNFLSFLFGMKAEDAQKRYDMRLAPGKENDKWYVYIDVTARDPRDKAEFTRAQLVLNRDNFLPRQLWYERPNGDSVVWLITKIDPNARINQAEFDAPKPPTGWKIVPVAAEATETPPTIVRPKQP